MGLTFCKLLKTNIEKMSVFRLSIMLKKINELQQSLHYVDEKKRSYEEQWLVQLGDPARPGRQ